MACSSCKEKKIQGVDGTVIVEKVQSSLILRLILFLITLVFIPLIVPVIVVILFNHIVLGKGFSFNWLTSIFKRKNKKEKIEEVEDINPDDYELIDVANVGPK